jgi:hypothetical protein
VCSGDKRDNGDAAVDDDAVLLLLPLLPLLPLRTNATNCSTFRRQACCSCTKRAVPANEPESLVACCC